MVVHFIAKLLQPPGGDLRQHGALVRNRLGHHDVESADAIGRDEQQAIVVDDVHLADLAAAQVCEGEGLELRDRHTRISSTLSCLSAVSYTSPSPRDS